MGAYANQPRRPNEYEDTMKVHGRQKVAVVVLNYRMPEMTDALVDSIRQKVKYPHDLYVIDNGTPEGEAIPKHTTQQCTPNRKFTGGFNFGLKAVQEWERVQKRAIYEAVWIVCNDIRLNSPGDPLSACMHQIKKYEDTAQPIGIIHPAIERGAGWNWPHMFRTHGTDGLHEAWFVDIIAPVYTRKMMNFLQWQFNADLLYGWGVDLYTCYEAWKNDMRVVVCDDAEVWHKMGTTYEAGKDLELDSFEALKAAAGGNQGEVLSKVYGEKYMELFQKAPDEYKRRR